MSMETLGLDRIRQLLMALVKAKGLTDEDLRHIDEETDEPDWQLHWWRNPDERFLNDLTLLQGALDLYEQAMAQHDLLAAQAGLLHARIQAQSLSSFFDIIRHDLLRSYHDPRLGWPQFPEDYKIPAHYGFKEF